MSPDYLPLDACTLPARFDRRGVMSSARMSLVEAAGLDNGFACAYAWFEPVQLAEHRFC
jgi:hypothetical protein